MGTDRRRSQDHHRARCADRTIGSAASDLWLGFMAYGHREKGSCTDIELLFAPAPSSGPEIAGTARELNPREDPTDGGGAPGCSCARTH